MKNVTIYCTWQVQVVRASLYVYGIFYSGFVWVEKRSCLLYSRMCVSEHLDWGSGTCSLLSARGKSPLKINTFVLLYNYSYVVYILSSPWLIPFFSYFLLIKLPNIVVAVVHLFQFLIFVFSAEQLTTLRHSFSHSPVCPERPVESRPPSPAHCFYVEIIRTFRHRSLPPRLTAWSRCTAAISPSIRPIVTASVCPDASLVTVAMIALPRGFLQLASSSVCIQVFLFVCATVSQILPFAPSVRFGVLPQVLLTSFNDLDSRL